MEKTSSVLYLNSETIRGYTNELQRRERSDGTIRQYGTTLEKVWETLVDGTVDVESLRVWKEEMAQRFAVKTVNRMIAAVNGWLEFSGAPELKMRMLRVQRQTFRENEITESDFSALMKEAQSRSMTTAALLVAIAATGVRVSEVSYLTVEAARKGVAVIRLKGKTRSVPLGESVCAVLLRFAKEKGIASGPVFLGRNGCPMDRR